MKCDWEFTEQQAKRRGWRYVRCKRLGCYMKGGPTPHELNNIQSSGCRGWPYWWEIWYWTKLLLQVFGVTIVEPIRLVVRNTEFDVSKIGEGPGKEMILLLEEIGIYATQFCECHARAELMNQWGVDGCEENREKIKEWLVEGAQKYASYEHLTAMIKTVRSGLVFRLNIFDRYGSLVDESIRRAQLSIGP